MDAVEEIPISNLEVFNILKINTQAPIVKEFFEYFGSTVLPVEDKVISLKKMTSQHILTHLHANNFNSTTDYDFVKVPDVFECTYIRKDSVKVLGMNDIPVPHPSLDFPNNVSREDIFLHGFPFSIC